MKNSRRGNLHRKQQRQGNVNQTNLKVKKPKKQKVDTLIDSQKPSTSGIVTGAKRITGA